MIKWLREKLGISAEYVYLCETQADVCNRVRKIEQYLESRDPCKICGHHRYNKAFEVPQPELMLLQRQAD